MTKRCMGQAFFAPIDAGVARSCAGERGTYKGTMARALNHLFTRSLAFPTNLYSSYNLYRDPSICSFDKPLGAKLGFPALLRSHHYLIDCALSQTPKIRIRALSLQ